MLCVSPPRGSCVSAWRTPFPSLSAVSTESISRRDPSSFFTTSRSTTTAMSCFLFLSRSMSSSRSRMTLSTRAREAALARVGQHFLVLALALLDQRREQRQPRPLRQLGQLLGDLLRALLAHAPAADGAVLLADRRVEDAQVVVDLGDGAHGGPRVVGRRLLLDGDGGRQSADDVVVRLLHLAEELPGVGGERLHVPPLAFRVQGVERERALPAAGNAGEHHQLLLGDLQRDALEVVLSGSLHEDGFGLHGGLVQEGTGQDKRRGWASQGAIRCSAGV